MNYIYIVYIIYLDNQINDKAMIQLCKSFKYTPLLMKISLTANFIGDDGIIELTNNLKFIPYLTDLSLQRIINYFNR